MNQIFKNREMLKTGVVISLLLIFSLFPSAIRAQFADFGQERSKIEWKELKSSDFSILFPSTINQKNAEALAKYYYTYLTISKNRFGISDYTSPLSNQFPLVIHPYNANSNGVTMWAPRQIHLFTTPPDMMSYPQNWNLQLAVHEWRHAWQISHFNRGFWRVMSYIFGEQAIGLASGVYPSVWFLEGDAVVAETEFAGVGRGTDASFLKNTLDAIIPKNADAQEREKFVYKKNRSWDRWRFGSVKYFSPNHYNVGYMINSMARFTSKDPNLSGKILNYERKQPLNANIVANAFQEYTTHTHREYTQDSLLQLFYKLNTPIGFIKKMKEQHVDFKKITTDRGDKRSGAQKGYYTVYDYILEFNKDTLLATITGYGTPSYLIMLTRDGDGWKDRFLRPMSSNLGGGVNVYKGREVFWTETITDKRWEQHANSKIFSYDVISGKTKEMTAGCDDYSYYSPAIERDTLYALCYSPLNSTSKVVAVRDLSNDKVLNRSILDFGTDLHITKININKDDLFFAAIDNTQTKGVALYKVSDFKKNAKVQKLIGFDNHIIKNLCLANDKLYFVTDYFGTDMICSISSSKEKTNGPLSLSDVKIESSIVGITDYDISSYSNKIYITKSDTDKGAFIYEQNSQDINVVLQDWEFDYPLAKELHRQLLERIEKENIPSEVEQDYEIKPYSKIAHLFKFHSWAPTLLDMSGATSGSFDQIVTNEGIGVSAFSQNILGTAVTILGYGYDLDKKRSSGHARFTYSGWYPVLEGSVHIGDEDAINKKFSFRSVVSAYIPFNFSKNGWAKGITPQIYWQYKNYETVASDYSRDRHLLVGTLSAYTILPTAKAQYFPRLGIGGRLYTGFSPAGKNYFGSIYAAYAYGYLPGFTFNQAFRISAAYQYQKAESFYLDNFIAEPRGYTEDIYGDDYVRATLDYAIPIYLGDISLGFFAYLKSVNIAPFVDLGFYSKKVSILNTAGQVEGSKKVWRNRSSVGVDVTFRTHLLRIGYPISIGFRYARTNRPGDIRSLSYSNYKKSYGKGEKNYVGLIMEYTFK